MNTYYVSWKILFCALALNILYWPNDLYCSGNLPLKAPPDFQLFATTTHLVVNHFIRHRFHLLFHHFSFSKKNNYYSSIQYVSKFEKNYLYIIMWILKSQTALNGDHLAKHIEENPNTQRHHNHNHQHAHQHPYERTQSHDLNYGEDK